MRTTLTLDPDVALQVKERLASSSVTLKDLVNETMRRGFATPPPAPLPPFVVEPFHLELPPGVNPDKLNQYLDDLEFDEYLVKRRKDELAWQAEHSKSES